MKQGHPLSVADTPLDPSAIGDVLVMKPRSWRHSAQSIFSSSSSFWGHDLCSPLPFCHFWGSLYLLSVSVYVGWGEYGCVCSMACVVVKVNFQQLSLSFRHMGPGTWTLIVCVGSNHLYPLVGLEFHSGPTFPTAPSRSHLWPWPQLQSTFLQDCTTGPYSSTRPNSCCEHLRSEVSEQHTLFIPKVESTVHQNFPSCSAPHEW